ncbi:MAG: hypothetical protein K2M48_02200, partial [Clostridiales bacterium]|nr:hypothetical protein [Clostridiales bacterium]
MASHKKAYIIDLAILIIVAVILAITMVWSREIELELGLSYYEEVDGEAAAALNAGKRSADGELRVHFVDIGQGDCAIIELPDGKNIIIDAGSGTSSAGPKAMINSTLEFVSDTLGDDFKYFDYAILTHPD